MAQSESKRVKFTKRPKNRKTVLDRQKRIEWNLEVINKMIKDHWDANK